MVCKYCGAEFEDNAPQCPFCHSENTELAERIYKKQVGEVLGKIRNVKEEAKKEERRMSILFEYFTLNGSNLSHENFTPYP